MGNYYFDYEQTEAMKTEFAQWCAKRNVKQMTADSIVDWMNGRCEK